MYASARTERFTIRELIRYAVSRFNGAGLVFGHGSDNAYDEAVYLVLFSLHLAPDTLEPFLDAHVLREESACVLDLIDERVRTRKPAAYLTHEAYLQGHRFYVDERVIVPRSPISELLQDSLAPWVADPHAVGRVLDMCTGSGCLAILAALAFPDAEIDAVDLSADALKVAERNVTEYGLQDRVRLHGSNLFSALAPACYDVIICNPPYVNQQSMDTLPQEFSAEPALALAGGTDGMDLVRTILRDAPQFLNDDGIIVLEIGHERAFFEAAFPQLEPMWLQTGATEDHLLLLTRDQLQS